MDPQILEQLQNQINRIKSNRANFGITNKLRILFIVHRLRKHDAIYIVPMNNDLAYVLHELSAKYVLELEFHVFPIGLHRDVLQSHLWHGEGRTRFYPEHLTRIIPRFFKKQFNYLEQMDTLYADWFKHGFAVDLNDSIFNKYYKMITTFDHVSVNYNRHILNIEKKSDAQNRLKIEKKHKQSFIQQCTLDNVLDIKQCTFIDYIIYCLNVFKGMKADTIEFGQYDLHRLSECYAHIICIHSFCLNHEQRKEIRTYVSEMVGGVCTNGAKCLCVAQHSTRRRRSKRAQNGTDRVGDEKENMECDPNDILYDVLLSCLQSLHCYLLHDVQHLYRIRREDGVDSDSRFTSAMDSNPLSFYDEMDAFIQYVLYQSHSWQWVNQFVQWLKLHHYDWDAVVHDIGCNTTKNVLIPNQSNIYSFLKEYKQQKLFTILNEKYVQKSSVGALNFGVSVLIWFEYGFKSEYGSLSEEVLCNKFSPLTKQMLQEYHEECKILIIQSTQTQYQYTFDELLSLKLYTDESKFTALFR
eukprot:731823_1